MFFNRLRLPYSIPKSFALLLAFHCSRHTMGSLHVENGTDMAEIQALLGHKNITTTQIYSKLASDQLCKVVDKITLKRKAEQ